LSKYEKDERMGKFIAAKVEDITFRKFDQIEDS